MDQIEIKLTFEPVAEGLPVPEPATPDSAGVDLRAALVESVDIPPRQWRSISTGIRLQIPSGYEGQVRPRSGLAARYGITCLNSPGTIDADYRGVVHVLLINHGPEPFTVNRGERIAQLVIAPVTPARFTMTESLDQTARGDGGFGHTGKH